MSWLVGARIHLFASSDMASLRTPFKNIPESDSNNSHSQLNACNGPSTNSPPSLVPSSPIPSRNVTMPLPHLDDAVAPASIVRSGIVHIA